MIIKGGRVLDSVKKCLHACLRARNIWLQWNINRNAPSSKGIKSRKGCGFQIHEVDSADDN